MAKLIICARYASGINLGMAIGVLTGLVSTAIIAYTITKRHSRRSPLTMS